jgi:hypothetical protein
VLPLKIKHRAPALAPEILESMAWNLTSPTLHRSPYIVWVDY